jgi:thiosulfate dehydrogenase
MIVVSACLSNNKNERQHPDTTKLNRFHTPADGATDALVKYGRLLVSNTSYYFGPKGTIAHKSNGMNCQNCHLLAGTKLFGNNFLMVKVSYPKFKERSGRVEDVADRVQDCFQRSLNGQRIDGDSREMKAFIAYLNWVGKNVVKGSKPDGTGIEELPFLNRPADPAKGALVFDAKCKTCHGKGGEGLPDSTGHGYKYPPLWGPNSYNIGASLYRLSKFAGYVANNMPFGATHHDRELTDAEAWDVAAFVNSQYHPGKDLSKDWPRIGNKPYDYPFGPYADHIFSEHQHKYGPFAPIKKYYAGTAK